LEGEFLPIQATQAIARFVQRLHLLTGVPGRLLVRNGNAKRLSEIRMGDKYLNLHVNVYEPSNPILYRTISVIKRIILLPRSFRPAHIVIRGTVSGGNSDLVLNYIGEGESLAYVKNWCFSKIIEEKTFPCKIWRLRKVIKNISSADIVLVELNSLLKTAVPAGGYETFPWIRQKVFLKDHIYGERKAKIESKYGRKARKYNYRFEIVNDTSSAKKFYQELFAPYINSRFGDVTHLRDLKEIQRVVKNGFILQVFDGETWIAGAACRRRKREVTVFALGLISDFSYHLQRGALSSAYYFLFKWAEDNGINTIDLLRSKPNVNDGVYEHKRFWGAIAEKDIWPHTCIRIFLPKGIELPSAIKGYLVRMGNGFIELEKAVNLC
jgi:hypothetical protein